MTLPAEARTAMGSLSITLRNIALERLHWAATEPDPIRAQAYLAQYEKKLEDATWYGARATEDDDGGQS